MSNDTSNELRLMTPAEFAAALPPTALRDIARLLLQSTPTADAAQQQKETNGHEAA